MSIFPDAPARQRRPSRRSRFRRSLQCAGATALLASHGAAQAPDGWRLASSAAANRWFAAMAALDLPTTAALPFYAARGRAPEGLRTALRSDGAFDILHFVPLYFPSATPAALIAVVRAAGGDPHAGTAARGRFLLGALTASLPKSDQRSRLAALADFADGLADEPPATTARLAALQSRWNADVAPALAPYLGARRLDRGVILVVPALGAEGRIFAGRPDDRDDNVIAVGDHLSARDADAPLFAAIRELCFATVTPALAALAAAPNATDAASRASAGAVRCGAALLDLTLPQRAPAYRAFWAGLARTDAFDAAFPPDAALDSAIITALRRDVRTKAPRSGAAHSPQPE